MSKNAMKGSWGPAGGIAFAVLFVVGTLLLVIEEIDGDTDEQIRSYYADSGNRTKEAVGFALVLVGVLCFLAFVAALRSRLRAVDPEPSTLSTVAFGAGVTAAASIVGGAVFLVATSASVDISNDFVVDPDLARFAVSVGYLLVIGSVVVNCVLVAATSLLALRTEILPSWLGWVGFAAVVLAVAEAFLLPIFVIPIWITVVSVVLLVHRPASEPHARQPLGPSA